MGWRSDRTVRLPASRLDEEAVTAMRHGLKVPRGVDHLFGDLVHGAAGIVFDAARLSLLVDRVVPLARNAGCRSLLEYYFQVRYNDPQRREWQRVIDAITVQESYFWREAAQFDALALRVVPRLAAGLRGPLRIWSAGCAAGEEPLSIAIALQEAGWFDRIPIEIIATDVSESALARASAGWYRPRAFRDLPETLRERHFDAAGGGFQVRGAIRERVRYGSLNLADPTAASAVAPVHVVFCRNVFIYFSEETMRRAIAAIAAAIRPRGVLFTGSADAVLRVTDAFDLEEHGSALAYARRQLATGA